MNDITAAFLKALINSSINFCFCIAFIALLVKLLPVRNPSFRYSLFLIPLIKLWYDFSSQIMTSGLSSSTLQPMHGGALDLCFFVGLGSNGLSLWSLIFSCILGTHAISMGDLALLVMGSGWTSLLLGAWAITAFLLILKRNLHYFQCIRNLVRDSHEDVELTAMMNDLSEQRGGALSWLRPRIMLSPSITTPMVMGVISPRILIPLELYRSSDKPALLTIITHELSHVVRWDNLVNHFFSFSRDLFFFLVPLMYLLRLLNLERERICDRMTIGEGKEQALHFARALLSVAELSIKRPQGIPDPAFVASSLYRPGKKELLSRVSEIVSLSDEGRGIFDNRFVYGIMSIIIFKLLIGVSFFASSELVSTTACAAMRIVVMA
jgi:beta-lactamase regulating signal transducer with metallopeptidase domain